MSPFRLSFASALLLVACGGPLKYDLPSTAKAPGADAHIVADVRAKQNQTQLEITITNLAPPGRVLENATSYLAWYRTADSKPWVRLGALQYDESSREASFSASVPEVSFELQVSAELGLDTASPSPSAVVSQVIAEEK